MEPVNMIAQARDTINQYSDKLRAIESRKKEIQQSEQYSPKYQAELIAKVDEDRLAKVDECKQAIEQIIKSELAYYTKAATPKPVDFAQRTYEAQAALQDMDASNPEGWLKLYRAAHDSGNVARKTELYRLIDARIGGSDSSMAWMLLVRELMTDGERAYVQALKEERTLRGTLVMIIGMLRDSTTPIQTSWDAIFSQMQNNADNSPAPENILAGNG